MSAKPSKKATVESLRDDLERLGMDTKGKKETLWKRLMGAFRARPQLVEPDLESSSDPIEPIGAGEKESTGPSATAPSTPVSTTKKTAQPPSPAPKQPFRSFLCFDVEATCEGGGANFDYPNEIIEFPVVLFQWLEDEIDTPEGGRQKTRKLVKVDTFHTYVRPTFRPKLSEFCSGLTGITQEMVDNAPVFPEVLKKLEAWMDSWGLRDGDHLKDAMWVTDGPWDLRDFIPKQLFITPPSPPRYPAYLLAPYLNLKLAVASILAETHRREASTSTSQPTPSSPSSRLVTSTSTPTRAWPRLTTGKIISRAAREASKVSGPKYFLNIQGQIEVLGLGEFEGKQHSGIDDATNIGRILCELANRNILIEPNSRLPPAKNSKTWDWMGDDGTVIWPLPDTKVNASGKVVKAVKEGRAPRVANLLVSDGKKLSEGQQGTAYVGKEGESEEVMEKKEKKEEEEEEDQEKEKVGKGDVNAGEIAKAGEEV